MNVRTGEQRHWAGRRNGVLSVHFTPPRGFAQWRETRGARSASGPAGRITRIMSSRLSPRCLSSPPSTLPEANQIPYVILSGHPYCPCRRAACRAAAFAAHEHDARRAGMPAEG